MAGILSSLGGLGIGNIVIYLMWGLIFVIVVCIMCGLALWLAVVKKSTKVIELNLETRKVSRMLGRKKKKLSKIKQLWVGKLKKFMPNIQENDYYTERGQDVVILLKDKNGLHHTARLPTYEEIKIWYEVQYGIKLDLKDDNGNYIYPKVRKKFETIYLMPNPSEDLDWLGTQCAEADKEYSESWWKHPTVMILGTAAMCTFMFIVALIFSAKM